MNALQRINSSRQGSFLLFTLGFLALAIGMVITIVTLSSNDRMIAAQQVTLDQAVYVAEGGLEQGCQYVKSNIVTLTSNMAVSTSTNFTGTINNGTFSYCLTRTNAYTFTIVSTGSVNGITRRVSMLQIYQPTYAEFALWSGTNGAIYFIAGDVFYGHVHANDAMYFDTSSGGPIFHSYCDSLTNYWVTYSNVVSGNLSGVEFDYGFQLNTYEGTMANIDFNADTNSLKQSATNLGSQGLVLNGASTITFNGTTMAITNPTTNWSNYTYTPNATNGLIYVANVSGHTATGNYAGVVNLLGGNVSGALTIVAENNVNVNGSLTYTVNPQSNAASTCALGLITQDNINITTNAPNNVTIDAAMICTGTSGDGSSGSFGVNNYSSGSPRGNLNVYGGIVQNVRGAVGTVNGSGSISTGYSKNYSFDPRFLSHPPPYYPVVGGVVIFSNWTEGPKQ